MVKPLSRLPFVFGILIMVAGAVSMIRTTASIGLDFSVFWRAAKFILQGDVLYSVSRDGAMIFKYPPWIVPFFFPLAWIPLDMAKWIWGIVETISLGYVVFWLSKQFAIPKKTLFLMLISFWGLWIVHAVDGQIALPMLAVTLHCYPNHHRFSNQLSFKSFFLTLALSTKIFTIFPLIGLKWSGQAVRTLAVIGILFGLLSIPAIWNEPTKSPTSLISSWADAARSSSKLMNSEQVRGRGNPGLPGFTLHTLKIPVTNSQADIFSAIFYCVAFGLLWSRISRNYDPKLAWLGWLALTPIVHPLPWWHLFIFVFPLAVVVADRSFKSNDIRIKTLFGFGMFLICLSSRKFGPLGIFLELTAAKSWGTLAFISTLILLEKKSSTGTPDNYNSTSKREELKPLEN